MTEILLPVGQPLGPMGDDDTAIVRVGDDYLSLDNSEYRLWLLAMAEGRRVAVETAAATTDLEEAPGTVESLLTRGVLLSYDPDDDLKTVLGAYCLLPSGMGVGPDEHSPGLMRIAGPDLVVRAAVEADTFMIWCHGPRADIWQEVETMARDRNVDPATLAHGIAADLPVLVCSGCAYLDRCP